MKKILLAIILCFSYTNTQAQDDFHATSEGFTFEINYWFNLHHFLWLESYMAVKADSTVIHQKLTDVSRKRLNRALNYYKTNLTDLDLKRSEYMDVFRIWITNEGKGLKSVPSKFQEHVSILKEVSGVYEEFFWPTHKNACEKIITDNIDLIRRTEQEYAKKIIKLTRQFWQSEKIKVDVTYYGKANDWDTQHRAYTNIRPTHVIMNVEGQDEVKGHWLEILYHESTHHLVLGDYYFIGGTINDVSEVLNIKPPRQLGHACHFYLTGELTKQLLVEEGIPYNSTYMQREGVFSRYYSALDKHLSVYMKRKITFEEAIQKIIAELNGL